LDIWRTPSSRSATNSAFTTRGGFRTHRSTSARPRYTSPSCSSSSAFCARRWLSQRHLPVVLFWPIRRRFGSHPTG
jgi:hypothetical protein